MSIVNKGKDKNMLLGVSSDPDRNMDIKKLIRKTKEIDIRHTIFVDKTDIIPNPENEKRFPQTDIEELKEWIYFRKKLYHDLIVVPVDGTAKYMIVDGERRYRAIMSLSNEQYSEVFPMGINCNVFPASTDSTLLKLDSTLANYLQRHTDVFLRRQEILDLYDCLTDLKERKIIDCDVVSHMADILGIKERQLKNYINTARLIPEFEEMLRDGTITLCDAVRFSALDNDSQVYLLKKYSSGETVSGSDFSKAKELSRIRGAEKNLKDISESLEKQKKLYENAHEELCSLTQKTKNKEKIRRQEKRELKARQRLLKEEKRYKDASDILTEIKQQACDGGQGSCHDADSVLESIMVNLEKLERNPNLVLSNKKWKSFLTDICNRLLRLVNNYEEIWKDI